MSKEGDENDYLVMGLVITWMLPVAGALLIFGTFQARKEATHGASHGR